jgi:hypothetical protein
VVGDADSELPISFNVTAANVYDGAPLPIVLKQAQGQYQWFQPTYVLAGKGYDAKECSRFMGEDLNAIPAIDVQKGRVGRPREERRPCEAMPFIASDGIRYRCERVP